MGRPRVKRSRGGQRLRYAAWLTLWLVASPSPSPVWPQTLPPVPTVAAPTLLDALGAQATSLEPMVLRLALEAVYCATFEGLLSKPGVLTLIDYSVPSTEPRLWVFDLAERRLLFEELVAHGKNTGIDRATHFSNEPGSLQTSLGLFVTADPYVGRHGYSLRLRGLEPGINDRAFERALVVHGASYVSDATAKSLGRLGRSWGCPAVREEIAQPLIDTIKGGSAVFSYYPDGGWLNGSHFLGRCPAAQVAKAAPPQEASSAGAALKPAAGELSVLAEPTALAVSK